MKERPILFSAPMVNAILSGTKTQTRRVIKPQPLQSDGEIYSGHINGPELYEPAGYNKHGKMIPMPEIYGIYDDDGEWGIKFPYGKVGDQLWVRETHSLGTDSTGLNICASHLSDVPKNYMFGNSRIFHPQAPKGSDSWCLLWKRRPSIFMPRWASRIQLEITGVRVERLNDCSETDALAEGITGPHSGKPSGDPWWPNFDKAYSESMAPGCGSAVESYQSLWETINGAGSWDANPWVWVIEFRVINS